MTIIWLFVYLVNGAPRIEWWPPYGWALALAICLFLDIASD